MKGTAPFRLIENREEGRIGEKRQQEKGASVIIYANWGCFTVEFLKYELLPPDVDSVITNDKIKQRHINALCMSRKLFVSLYGIVYDFGKNFHIK